MSRGVALRGPCVDNVGAHMSIAGGLPQALRRGREVGCSVVQLFLKNQVRWTGRPLEADEIREFRRAQAATGIRAVFGHATYLINLAGPDAAEWRRSVAAFHEELVLNHPRVGRVPMCIETPKADGWDRRNLATLRRLRRGRARR